VSTRRTRDERRLYVFGAGGHGRELAWLAREARDDVDLVFLVDDAAYMHGPVDGAPVRLLADEQLGPGDRFVVGVGDPEIRQRVARSIETAGADPAILVHPRAEVAPSAILEPGAVVAAGSVVSTGTRIGRHAHVNVACSISHDVVLGDFATLSPGVHLAGNVHVGRGAFVGIGASVINGSARAPLIIGDGAVVAAGACVTGSVPSHSMVAGVPARRKR
jgi:sugar O-acyltransferase (sialic acid O-acetyltransferase NeuD family)